MRNNVKQKKEFYWAHTDHHVLEAKTPVWEFGEAMGKEDWAASKLFEQTIRLWPF